MDKSGIAYLVIFAVVATFCFWLDGIIGIVVGIIAILCAMFTLFFFRDPVRKIPEDAYAIVSPADGVVVAIDEFESAPIGKGQRLAIFMSPLNVHINRAPTDGEVVSLQRFPGKFYKAFDERASLENERVDILLSTSRGNIVVKQIAGIIARRIVCRAKVGDTLRKGQKYGIIHFGSRVEIVLPKNADFLVGIGDKVFGGETIIAKWLDGGK